MTEAITSVLAISRREFGMGVSALPERTESRDGVTYAQAMEMFDRFCVRSQAVPTISHEMHVPYETCCQVIGGNIWPAAYQYWVNLVLP